MLSIGYCGMEYNLYRTMKYQRVCRLWIVGRLRYLGFGPAHRGRGE